MSGDPFPEDTTDGDTEPVRCWCCRWPGPSPCKYCPPPEAGAAAGWNPPSLAQVANMFNTLEQTIAGSKR